MFNVTKTAVGVEVTKVVGNRQLRKRLHVRIEHVRKSRCNEHFLKRVKENDVIKQEAKKRGEKASVKRVPPGPKPGKIVNAKEGVRAGLRMLHRYCQSNYQFSVLSLLRLCLSTFLR